MRPDRPRLAVALRLFGLELLMRSACPQPTDEAWVRFGTTARHRIDRLLRDFYSGWDLMVDNKIYSCGEPSKREGLT